jgi:hypothetical protein
MTGSRLAVLREQCRELTIQQRGIAQIEGQQTAQVAHAIEIGFIADDADLPGTMVRDMPFHAHADIIIEAQLKQAGRADGNAGNRNADQRAAQGQIKHLARPLPEKRLKNGRTMKMNARIMPALNSDHKNFRQ